MFYTFWFYLKETRPHTCIHEHMYMHEHAHTHIHTHTQWSPKKTLVKKKRIHNRKRRHLESRNPNYGQRAVAMKAARMNLRITSFLSLCLSPSFPSSFPCFHPSFLFTWNHFYCELPSALYLEPYKYPYMNIIKQIYLKFGSGIRFCSRKVARGTLGIA